MVGDVRDDPIIIYGCYMPSRGGRQDEVDAAWDVVTPRVAAEARAWVVGDLNAEARAVVGGRGKTMTHADWRMDTLIQAAGLTRTGRGRPTHAGGGEIDHVLAGRRHAGTVGEAKLLTWHGKDHDCVYADYHYQVDAEGQGPAREVGIALTGFTDADWAVYEKLMKGWCSRELGGANMRGERGGIAVAEMIQAATHACAVEVKAQVDARHEKRVDGEKRGGTVVEEEEEARGSREGGGEHFSSAARPLVGYFEKVEGEDY